MGGKKSKDNSARDRQRTQEGTDRLWSKRTSDEDVMGMFNSMQSGQLSAMLAALGALIDMGNTKMGDNIGMKHFAGNTGQAIPTAPSATELFSNLMPTEPPEDVTSPMPQQHPSYMSPEDYRINMLDGHAMSAQNGMPNQPPPGYGGQLPPGYQMPQPRGKHTFGGVK